MLQFFTFWIAYYLKIFRNGKALGRTVSSQKQEVMVSLKASNFVVGCMLTLESWCILVIGGVLILAKSVLRCML